MKLKDYLKQRKISQRSFAKLLKTEESQMSKYLLGKVKVGRNMAKRIEIATNGYVTILEAMFPDFEMPTKGKKKKEEIQEVQQIAGQLDLF